MRPALALLALLPWLPLAPARAEVPQVCALLLPPPGEDLVRAAHETLKRDGCQPGDALMVVGSGVSPAALMAGLCRAGAPVRRVEWLDAETMQLHCEYPGQPGPRAARR